MNPRRRDDTPPRAARRLLELCLPAEERESVLGDLHEAYLERPAASANAWYWTQALAMAAFFTLERLRDLRPSGGRSRERVRGADTLGRRGGWTMGEWIRSLKLAGRSLVRRPGFSVVCLITLALGIGANTALFSVLWNSILKPLPYPELDRLVWLSGANRETGNWGSSLSMLNLRDVRERSVTLDGLAFYGRGGANFAAEGGAAQRVSTIEVEPGFLEVLGLRPALGRDLSPADAEPGGSPVAILGHEAWRNHFGGSPEAVGSSVIIDGTHHTVIGVAPPELVWPGGPAAILPYRWNPAEVERQWRWVNAAARLDPRATLAEANDELRSIYDDLARTYPDEVNPRNVAFALPIQEAFTTRGRRSLYLLQGAFFTVFLIALVNVVSLMLVRAESRRREVAIRLSLGAGRRGVVQLFLGEALLLSLVGSGLGVLVALVGVDLVAATLGSVAGASDAALSGPALLVALITLAGATMAVGLVPAFTVTRQKLGRSLATGDRSVTRGGDRLLNGLVVTEVALTAALVVGAGLLVNSYRNISGVDMGLAGLDEVVTFQIAPPESGYPDAVAVAGLHDTLLDRLERLPEVRAAGITSRPPFEGGSTYGRIEAAADSSRFVFGVEIRSVKGDFFRALGLPILRGRAARATGDEGAGEVVVSRSMARELFPDSDPVGALIREPYSGTLWQVTGVVADFKDLGPLNPIRPAMYFPFPEPFLFRQVVVTLRTDVAAANLVRHVREVVRSLDPALPVFTVRTLEEIRQGRVQDHVAVMKLLATLSLLSLTLGAVGLYGVVSFTVARRTREMGIRLALGALPRKVVGLVLTGGVGLASLGIGIGLAGAYVASQWLDHLLFQVQRIDPGSYATGTVLLLLVAAAACVLPALRASSVDPVRVLNEE